MGKILIAKVCTAERHGGRYRTGDFVRIVMEGAPQEEAVTKVDDIRIGSKFVGW
jgi:hypothetical protein